ncbi:MAG TPA: response regulator [Tepidisphaeraceae bacterium]|jgi:DNA-binding response OmpR family regulator
MRSPITPCNILVLDASALAATALARLLRLDGNRVIVAQSVTEACARCDAEPFDLLVTDLEFSDGSGLAVLPRARRATGATRGIVVSAHQDETYRQAAARAGFDAYLLKPVKWKQVRILVHRLLPSRADSADTACARLT